MSLFVTCFKNTTVFHSCLTSRLLTLAVVPLPPAVAMNPDGDAAAVDALGGLADPDGRCPAGATFVQMRFF